MEVAQAARLLNLVVCLMVVAGGLYFLQSPRQGWAGEYRFLYRAFTCWWLAWLAWVALFAIQVFEIPTDEDARNLISLACTDVNMVFNVQVYFFLTRGNDFKISDAFNRAVSISLALIVSYVVLYPYFRDFNSAFAIQEQWELCLGVVTIMLLGWAFSLRYRTRVVLVVGYIYAFLQPFAYQALLGPKPEGENQDNLQVILVVLAFMKVVFATVVTKYFLQEPTSTANLVKEDYSGSKAGFFRGWTMQFAAHTFSLLAGFTLLLILLLPKQLLVVTQKISLVVVFCGILAGVVKLWNYYASTFNDKADAKDNTKKE